MDFAQSGVRAVIHYLDDFLILHPCHQYLSTTLQACQELGVPIAPEKTEGPTQSLTFLGIQLDSANMTSSLTAERVGKIYRQWWNHSTYCSQVIRDLHFFNSFLGHLVHAA